MNSGTCQPTLEPNMVPQVLPEVTPEDRARSKSWHSQAWPINKNKNFNCFPFPHFVVVMVEIEYHIPNCGIADGTPDCGSVFPKTVLLGDTWACVGHCWRLN